MGFFDRWVKRRKKPISKVVLDSVIADLQAKEEERRAIRPKVTLPGGEVLFHEEDDMGCGWWWTTDRPVISEPGGRQFTLIIRVDDESEGPSIDQMALLEEVLDHLPDLLATFKKRLPKECLEFDFGGECLENSFRTLQGWILWFEPSSSHEYDWAFICHVPQEMGRHTYEATFVGLELVRITPTY